jgi:hypothetical protein
MAYEDNPRELVAASLGEERIQPLFVCDVVKMYDPA